MTGILTHEEPYVLTDHPDTFINVLIVRLKFRSTGFVVHVFSGSAAMVHVFSVPSGHMTLAFY
jgi:hypothetical protein